MPDTVKLRISRWVNAGFVRRIEGKPLRFVMVDDAPANPPQVGASGAITVPESSRERLWRVMRVLRNFDIPTLIIVAEAGEPATRTYMNLLRRAGYVAETKYAEPANGQFARYRLIKNPGPKTPTASHGRADGRNYLFLVDPNTGDRIDISPHSVSLRRVPDAAAVVPKRSRLRTRQDPRPSDRPLSATGQRRAELA